MRAHELGNIRRVQHGSPGSSSMRCVRWDELILLFRSTIPHSKVKRERNKLILTTVGTNGGLIRLSNKSSHAIFLKNACFLTSSASRSLEPKRRSGFFLNNYKKPKLFHSSNTTFYNLPFS